MRICALRISVFFECELTNLLWRCRCLTLGAIYQRALVESYASSLCRGWAWAEAYSLAYLQTIEIDPVTGCTTLTTITTESAARSVLNSTLALMHDGRVTSAPAAASDVQHMQIFQGGE